MADGLYKYLRTVMKESLEAYTKSVKQARIKGTRRVVEKIWVFADTTEALDCIEEELSEYKREGCKIQPSGTVGYSIFFYGVFVMKVNILGSIEDE